MPLVLTRKLDETIVIEGGITIRLLQLKKHNAKLSIEAPSTLKIMRGELLAVPDRPPAAEAACELEPVVA